MKNILSTVMLEIQTAIVCFTVFEKCRKVGLEVMIRRFSNRHFLQVSDTRCQIPYNSRHTLPSSSNSKILISSLKTLKALLVLAIS